MWRCLILVALLLCVLWVFGCAGSGGVPFGTGGDPGSVPVGDGTQNPPPQPPQPPPPSPWPQPPPNPPTPPIWP